MFHLTNIKNIINFVEWEKKNVPLYFNFLQSTVNSCYLCPSPIQFTSLILAIGVFLTCVLHQYKSPVSFWPLVYFHLVWFQSICLHIFFFGQISIYLKYLKEQLNDFMMKGLAVDNSQGNLAVKCQTTMVQHQ